MPLRLIDVLSRFQFEISKAVETSAVRVKVRVPGLGLDFAVA